MEFKGPLNTATISRVTQCDSFLTSPARLAALARTKLMDSGNDEAFERLARLAAQLLNAPLTIISLVSDQKQFFKAGYGLPSPYDTMREVPISQSICRYTLAGHEIVADDAKNDALLMHHPTTEPWGIAAFIAIPMTLPNGHVLGAFCAVDIKARPWTQQEIETLRELTKSVMTEIQLRSQIEELAQERLLREQFVMTLSHDLRNPIGAAKMSAEILATDTSDSTERKKLSKFITDAMSRADLMLRDLLNVLSLKAGELMKIDIDQYDYHEILKTTVEALNASHPERVKLSSPGSLRGTFDPQAVRRMVENLVTNGIKYGTAGETVSVQIQQIENRVVIDVHNHGAPIATAELNQLFEPFSRLDSAKKGSQDGWGIGLAIVHGLATAHGGSVKVRSTKEEGTRFRLILPLHAEGIEI